MSVGSSDYIKLRVDHIKKLWVHCIKFETKVSDHFEYFKNLIDKETWLYTSFSRSINEREYFASGLSKILDKHDIRKEFHMWL